MNVQNEAYYNDLLKDLENVLREQEIDVIKVICKRLELVGKLNPTSINQMIKSGKYARSDLKKIQRIIKKHTRLADKEIDAAFKQAAIDSQAYADMLAAQAGGVSYDANVLELAQAMAKRYKEKFLNMADTYAFKTDGQILSIRRQYVKAINRAVTAATTGTLDYNSAIRQTVKDLADSGIRTVEWESGYTRRADSSVRMNILEGIRQINQEIVNGAGDVFATGYEISAHERPAPDHADIQGKQFTRAEYETLNASLKRPIGTLNCMHFAWPIVYGVSKPTYSAAELARMKADGAKEYTWKGKKLNGYQCTQMQRRYETAIRTAKERELALRESGDKIGAAAEDKRIRAFMQEYKAFSQHVGLKPKWERTRIVQTYND